MTTTAPAALSVDGLIASLARNLDVIGRQTAGLSHQDSLLQPESRGNCLNWVLGHILVSRQDMLKYLGQPAAVDPETLAHYVRNGEPVLGDGDGVLGMDDLMAGLGTSQEHLATSLATASAESLTSPAPASPDMSVVEFVQFLMWHETYHLGQTEYLRQLTGVNDKVI